MVIRNKVQIADELIGLFLRWQVEPNMNTEDLAREIFSSIPELAEGLELLEKVKGGWVKKIK